MPDDPSDNARLGLESTITATPVGVGPGARADGASGASIATAEAAIEHDEADRTRIFLRLTIALAFAVVAPLPFLVGDVGAKWLLAATALVVAAAGAWFLWVLAAPESRYAEWKKVLVGVACGACGCAGVYYWGIFSPASLVLLFGVFFVSPQGSFASGLAVYAQCALFQLGLASAVQSGLILDRGVFHPPPIPHLDFIFFEVVVQGVLLSSFFFARATRGTALRAIGELERTVRDAARREALLFEAREDLARALRVGGPGRFTDQTLGSFSLGPLIGRGGMGEVYEARHVHTGEVAAVKMLHRHLLVDADQVARFVREARVVASIESDHVVRVLEVANETSPVPFLAMERLFGRDLADVLRDERPTTAEMLAMIDGAARGVAAAHAAGIVHRDLKPQNVFRVERAGRPPAWKVLDFGLSKLTEQTSNLTRGQVVGTPAYMAPEQARGIEVDARADVYALAAIAYRAITGQPPFHGTDLMAVLLEVVTRMPTRPRVLAPGIPEDVERVLLIGLAKDPADRFASASELASSLSAAFGGGLDAATRARGAALGAKYPWGEKAQTQISPAARSLG